MEIATIIEGISEPRNARQPWIYYGNTLAEKGIYIRIYRGSEEGFQRPFDAMLLHVWQDWANKEHFKPSRILRIMGKYVIFRAECPHTIQIILNHTDMSRRPYATPYWRPGDPILYRTPAYNRQELYPFPPGKIWAYEGVGENRVSFPIQRRSIRPVSLAAQAALLATAGVLQRGRPRSESESARRFIRARRRNTMKSWPNVK